jgi:Ca2+-binding RTX toxin-like protein
VQFTRIGDHLLVEVLGTGESIQVTDHFRLTGSHRGIDQLTFSDGTILDRASIQSNTWLRGTAGNNSISGSLADDNIDGGAGNDTISAGSGSDVIVGGAGNDSLTGGAGDDTFVFKSNFGIDVINDFKDTATENDMIELDQALFSTFAAVQAAMTQEGANVVLTYDMSNKITIKNATVANFNQDDFRFVA